MQIFHTITYSEFPINMLCTYVYVCFSIFCFLGSRIWPFVSARDHENASPMHNLHYNSSRLLHGKLEIVKFGEDSAAVTFIIH